tara:strand:+ start:238 stop:810 length:573 start_codon:yes stop_codon:yes gene_type:complete
VRKIKETYRGLNEGDVESDVNAAVSDIEQYLKSAERSLGKRTNESGAVDILGLVLSTPFLLKIVGKGLATAQSYIKRNGGNEKMVGDYIVKFSDKMHHMLMKPFELLASRFTSDHRKQEIFAEVVIAGVVFVLMAMSGLSAARYMTSLRFKPAGLYTFKTLVKGAEVKPTISKIMARTATIAKDMMSKTK